MLELYSRWIDRWERQLAGRDTNRQVRPFDWGLDWLNRISLPAAPSLNGDPARYLDDFAAASVSHSDCFFAYDPPRDFQLRDGHLTFTSPVDSPYPENNVVHADFFPVEDARRRAVLVLPQWNADSQGHVGLCKLLNRFGMTALRMNLAYHDRRMPAGLQRAEYHMSSNLGRTVHACRQSVLDSRACLDWLQERGYKRLAILGTSLGSCIAFITLAHDTRIATAALNHISMYVGDVVWTGLSTKHVRAGFGEMVNQDQLRRYWSAISPASYLDRLVGRHLHCLLVWARHDTTFLPQYSRQVIEAYRARDLAHEVVTLPCAHYTTGRFPFNVWDGVSMCRFLRRNL